MRNGEPNIQLKLETEINEKAFVAVLNFRKLNETNVYFFNSYHASLQRKHGEITDRAFYVNKGKAVTAKEAFNLLDGRSAHKDLTTKDGTKYKAWIQLDFDKKDKTTIRPSRSFMRITAITEEQFMMYLGPLSIPRLFPIP